MCSIKGYVEGEIWKLYLLQSHYIRLFIDVKIMCHEWNYSNRYMAYMIFAMTDALREKIWLRSFYIYRAIINAIVQHIISPFMNNFAVQECIKIFFRTHKDISSFSWWKKKVSRFNCLSETVTLTLGIRQEN